MGIYTNLAMEARELHPELAGVEEVLSGDDVVRVSRIQVKTKAASRKIGKPTGMYVTIDAPDLAMRPLDLFGRVSQVLSNEILQLMGKNANKGAGVLVIGLGNRFITPDSLGPRVLENVFVTRHILEYMPDVIDFQPRAVSAVAPSVLGITGIETLEIVKGVVEKVKPALVIAIDSLASRRSNRISTTIQLTDAGIEPGAGVGNWRNGINEAALGVPVVALGVPMVVYASTISHDAISAIAQKAGLDYDDSQLEALSKHVIDETIGQMIVTPKDIDSIVSDMARILADGINMALQGVDYENVRMLIA